MPEICVKTATSGTDAGHIFAAKKDEKEKDYLQHFGRNTGNEIPDLHH